MNTRRVQSTAIGESNEFDFHESPQWAHRLRSAFPALTIQNYRMYFAGQSISLIGSWLQIVCEGWLVLQLTNSAFLVGVVTALGHLPVLLFSLFSGVIVDRYDKRKIILLTQIAALILSFILGILTVFGVITVVHIAILAFLLGTVTAIELPARQAFIAEMVGKEQLASAVAINSGVFNGARVVGPGVAGLLIATVGIGNTFLINSASYIAAIITLQKITTQSRIKEDHDHPIEAIKEGLRFSFSHPVIKWLMVASGLMAIFGWSYSTLLPVITQNVYHKDASYLGYLYAAAGLGALLAAFLVSAYGKKRRAVKFIIGGNVLFSIGIILFSFTDNPLLALLLLFVAGFGLVMLFSMLITTIQHMTPDSLRGRVMSIFTLMFLGLSPIGSFQIGLVAEQFNEQLAVRVGGVAMLLFAIFLYMKRQSIREQYKEYSDT